MFQVVLIENMYSTNFSWGIVAERTGRLGNCLERVSIIIIPIAWIGLFYLFVGVIVN